MNTGEVILGVIMLLAGAGIAVLGIYYHATAGARARKSPFRYVLTWLLGVVLLVIGAIVTYDGTKGDGEHVGRISTPHVLAVAEAVGVTPLTIL